MMIKRDKILLCFKKIYLFTRVYALVCVSAPVSKHGGQRRMLKDLLHHSLPITLRRGLSLAYGLYFLS